MKTSFARLKKIEEIGIEKSYDFEVKNAHRIIAKNKFSNNAFYTSNCHHPDIEEFITAKQTSGRLTKFNMSVLITDDFMEAVKNNQPWNLEFPNYDAHPTEYKKIWNGNLKKWKSLGLTTTIYKMYANANQLWDIIMTSTYTRNEPGVLFVDTINKLNNLQYCEYISSSNPCGEQVLPISGCCLLGSINLTQFVDFDKKNWDYDKLKKLIPIAVRFMDNVNDKTTVPLESQKKSLTDKRRIGLGLMGYGSALMMMKIKYGSDKALTLTEDLMKFLANQSYQASSLLAEEKGSFPSFDKDKYLESNFIKQALDKKTIEMIKIHGLRNSHLLSIQPTGNTSIVCNNTSGGLEPLFMPKYTRTSVMPYAPDGLDKPKNIDWENKAYESSTTWTWIKEGDESLLRTEFGGYFWKFDKSRGLLRENIVMDYAVRFLESKGEWNEKAEWASTTTELNIKEHIDTMSVISRYIDSAMSKCVVEGTLITTNIGIVPIESLSDNKIEDSFSTPNNDYKILDENGDLKKISNHYYGGEKDCYGIKFSNGFYLESAFTHKFKTEDGWKSVLDLKENDEIYFRINNTQNKNEYIKIKEIPNFRNCIKCDYPTLLDENYAKFIGMMLSDGSFNKNCIGIVEKNEKVGKEIDRLFNVLFNINPKISIDKRSGVKYHYLNSRSLRNYYKNFIGDNALNKKIPNEILLSNDDVKKSFIEGLSLDGYIKEDGNLVIYEGYSKDIQIKTSYILSSLGYDYYLGDKKVKNGRLSKISYMVKGYLTDKSICPIEEHKCEYATYGRRMKQVFVEDREIYNDLPKTKEDNYYLFRNLRKSLKSSSFTRKEQLDSLGIDYDDNLTCVSVRSINYIGKKRVYDIEVEDTHSYLINGVVSHNTINLPNEYQYEDFKGLYTDMYNTGTIKGGTTYRAGTMTSVLSDNKLKTDDIRITKTNSPRRPKTLNCDINHLTIQGVKWLVVVGLMGKDPYEIFAFKKKSINISEKVKEGKLIKVKSGRYDLELEMFTLENLKEHFESVEEEALTRMISTSLRHGADINFIYSQLQKSEGTIVSFSKAVARTLKRYLQDDTAIKMACPPVEEGGCGSPDGLVMQEGCYKCKNCGYSKC